MIELRRPLSSPEADAVAAELAGMVVAHRIVADPSVDGPVLRDGHRQATDPDQIESFLAALRRDLADWGRFQSDSCYIDDDGTVC